MPVRALYHVLKAVMHHKTSRPYLRNPRSQLLINPALPRVQSNKPQPCSPHVTLASASTVDSHHPCLTLLAGRLARRLRFGRQVNQTLSPTLIGRRKVSSAGMPPPSPRAPSPLISIMSKTEHGAGAELLGDRLGLARGKTTSVGRH